ncbi:hypothetical protein M1M96_00660 [Peptococcaceae bacterium]|nr:hypothetical protein [Peptococcaceae bacterium]MCL0052317.1 hypothetical protein [Peptococcaceae bacterium]MCL0062717.1 hypothetical protein [Peptococcaceae bacterium]MCL0106374.1 hypothetical protein [Peptococcaceae bacterium]
MNYKFYSSSKFFDLVIKGGIIVTAADVFSGDIAIKKDKIVAIGTNLADYAAKVIDAENKYILPGGVDIHTHLDMPF